MGFLKKEPALRQSASPSTMSMPLPCLNLADGVVDLDGRGRLAGEVAGEVGVGQVRGPDGAIEAEGDAG